VPDRPWRRLLSSIPLLLGYDGGGVLSMGLAHTLTHTSARWVVLPPLDVRPTVGRLPFLLRGRAAPGSLRVSTCAHV
jgi:hypothetical protein